MITQTTAHAVVESAARRCVCLARASRNVESAPSQSKSHRTLVVLLARRRDRPLLDCASLGSRSAPTLRAPLRTYHTSAAWLKNTMPWPSHPEQRRALFTASTPSVHYPLTCDDHRIETSFGRTSPPPPRAPFAQRRTSPRRHRTRHRRRRQTPKPPSFSPAQQPCSSWEDQEHPGNHARADDVVNSPNQQTESTGAPSRRPAAVYRLSPLEGTLCQHIQRGAWRTAVELLQTQKDLRARETTTTLHFLSPNTPLISTTAVPAHAAKEMQRAAAAALERPLTGWPASISLEERCVWLLLWRGDEAAAWRVWRWMQTQTSSSLFSSSSWASSVALHEEEAAAASPSVSAPPSRLPFAFTLFLHFVGQDSQRTQDVLLALEVAARARRTVVAGGQSPLSASAPSTPSRRHAQEERACASPSGEGAVEEWMLLFNAWLRCLVTSTAAKADETDALLQSFSQFYNAAVRRMAACVGEVKKEQDATVVALLLLSAYAQLFSSPATQGATAEAVVADGLKSASQVPSPLSPAPSMTVALELVEEEFWRSASTLRAEGHNRASTCDKNGELPNLVTSVFLHPRKEGTPAPASLQRKTRSAFAAAARQLSTLHRHHARRSTPALAYQRDAHPPAQLPRYRFWFQQWMYAMGCADRWVALVDALEGSNDNDTASCSSTERLRQINAATDSNDWETALQLCLLPQSDGHATAQLPWLQRLRKGLTACEAAAKTSSDVPWQGALALWRFAQLHHRGDCDCGGGAAAAADLTREYGRIFQLLASATRWAESLRCFHASPTRYLDGFVVAQVGYALRASSAHLDRAVLDLWATWRCRVGDGVEPREEAVVQLLQAMLHMSSSSSFSAFTQQSASSATLSSSTTASDASCDHEDPVEIASTVQTPAAVVAADVATKLLVAAAASTTSPASKTSQPEGREQNADDARRLPGTRVPLDWRHRRHLVRRLLTDRWAGDWVEALQVAEASEDVSLLRLVAPRVPRSHPSSLYADTVHRLRERGVELTAGDRAALWAMWGNTRARDEGVPRGNASGPHGHESDARRRHCSADVWERGGDVAQIAHAAEFLLVELLGADEEDAPPTQVKTP